MKAKPRLIRFYIEKIKTKFEKTYGGMKFGDYRQVLKDQGKAIYEEVTEKIHAQAGSVAIDVEITAVTNHDSRQKPGKKIEFITTWSEPETPPIIEKPHFSYTVDGQTLWSSAFRNIPSRFTADFNRSLKWVSHNIAATEETLKKLKKDLKEMEVLSKQEFKYSKELQEARRRIREIDGELIALEREAQEKEREELAKEGEVPAQLSMAPKGSIAQTREANPEALEELRKDVYEWLKDVLPKSVLKRIAVELTPHISRKGKSTKLSEKQWAEIHKQPGEIMGAATTNALRSFIEISYNFDNDTIQKLSLIHI